MSLLSNLSYTNKDFNSIYNELLDLVDKISPTWKPGSANGSNESDPGVLLLKLDALMADKNNYNIDKNVLELFPDSVSQYPNARELYEQCGYIMPYYQAAEAYVTINLMKTPNDDDSLTKYTFEPFLQLTNNDGTVKYTIVDTDITILVNPGRADFRALQGTHMEYTVNGNNIITQADLDYNNRLYFKETNIAENGIFIQSVVDDEINYESSYSWTKVDNLLTIQQNTLGYKFGVSRDGGQCYIEFPSDIANLMGEGIHIDYILTDGAAGNIGKNVLKKFVPEKPNIIDNLGNDAVASISNNTDNEDDATVIFYINNYQASYDGADPETLEDARKNYERTKNTFYTLVSLNDYNNFILNSSRISNGFICDRTNDIQATTKIVVSDGNIINNISQVALDSNEEPQLSAFNLKSYMLKKASATESVEQFDLGFELVPYNSSSAIQVRKDMDDIKTIQHDFIKLNEEEIANIHLYYPINVKVFPYNKIDVSAQAEIEENILKALLKILNSSEMEYGKEVDYDLVYDTIIKSDPRIKSIILEDFNYTPYAISLTADKLTQITNLTLTGSNDEANRALEFNNLITAKCVLGGLTPLYEPTDKFYYNILQTPSSSPYQKDIGKISTETKLTLTPSDNKASITLIDNENIYLTSPNYITKDSYSTYVKYFYSIPSASGGLSSNQIYELTDNDYIIFFWKEEDDDDAPYFYEMYTAKTNYKLISPSFLLNASSTPEPSDANKKPFFNVATETIIKGIFNNNLDSKRIYGKLEAGSHKIGDQFYSDSQIIAQCDDNTILSGVKQITIKDENTITLNGTNHNIYWVLNNTTKINNTEYYQITFTNNEYTLDSDEYLFYAPKDQSYFALLGAGTKLQIGQIDESKGTSIPTKIEVEARTYEEVLYGKDSLLGEEGLWYSLSKNLQITATEMQFYNLGSGTILEFSDIPAGKTIIIDNGGIKYQDEATSNLSDLILSYHTEDSNPITLPKVTGGWSGYSRLNLKCGPSESQTLVTESGRYQSITITHSYANDEFTPKTSNIILSGTTIESEYSLNMIGGANIDVTAVNLLGERFANSFYCFSERELEDYEELTTDNKLKLELDDDNNTQIIEISLPELASNEGMLLPIQLIRDYEECYLVTNVRVSLTSSSNFVMINTGTKIKIETDGVFKTDKPLTKYEDNTSTSTGESLSPGIYIATENTKLIYSYNGDEEDKLTGYYYEYYSEIPFNQTSPNMMTKGLYYFKFINNPTSTEWYLCTKIPENQSRGEIYIHPITKYKFDNSTDPLVITINPSLFNQLSELDIKNKFNYTYKVSDNDLIENPTSGNAFLDTNHPYNRCTICKWDHKNSRIQIVNKAR